jgi:hypothetical protein
VTSVTKPLNGLHSKLFVDGKLDLPAFETEVADISTKIQELKLQIPPPNGIHPSIADSFRKTIADRLAPLAADFTEDNIGRVKEAYRRTLAELATHPELVGTLEREFIFACANGDEDTCEVLLNQMLVNYAGKDEEAAFAALKNLMLNGRADPEMLEKAKWLRVQIVSGFMMACTNNQNGIVQKLAPIIHPEMKGICFQSACKNRFFDIALSLFTQDLSIPVLYSGLKQAGNREFVDSIQAAVSPKQRAGLYFYAACVEGRLNDARELSKNPALTEADTALGIRQATQEMQVKLKFFAACLKGRLEEARGYLRDPFLSEADFKLGLGHAAHEMQVKLSFFDACIKGRLDEARECLRNPSLGRDDIAFGLGQAKAEMQVKLMFFAACLQNDLPNAGECLKHSALSLDDMILGLAQARSEVVKELMMQAHPYVVGSLFVKACQGGIINVARTLSQMPNLGIADLSKGLSRMREPVRQAIRDALYFTTRFRLSIYEASQTGRLKYLVTGFLAMATAFVYVANPARFFVNMMRLVRMIPLQLLSRQHPLLQMPPRALRQLSSDQR